MFVYGCQLFRNLYTAEISMGTLPIARNEEMQDWHDDRLYQIKLDEDAKSLFPPQKKDA